MHKENVAPLCCFELRTSFTRNVRPVTSESRHTKKDMVSTLQRRGWSPGPWSSGLGWADCKGQALCGAVGEESEAGAAVDLPQRICCCSATLSMHEQSNCGEPRTVRTAQHCGFD